MKVDDIFACPGALFWDVYIDQLNPYYDYEFIIMRTLTRIDPDCSQLFELDKVYPREVILDVLEHNQSDMLGIEMFEDIGKHYDLDLTKYPKYNYLHKAIRGK